MKIMVCSAVAVYVARFPDPRSGEASRPAAGPPTGRGVENRFETGSECSGETTYICVSDGIKEVMYLDKTG